MSSYRKKLLKFSVVLLTLTATPKPLAAYNLSSLSNVTIAQSVNTNTTYPLPESLPSGTKIRLSGSSSMAVINEALKQRYQEKYPNAEIELVTSNANTILQGLLEGETDLVAVGRFLTAEEKEQGLVEVPINRGKIAIIVGSDNPFIENLSFDQFAKIFRGEITNWSEVGGPEVPIRFIDRPESSDTRKALESYDVFKQNSFQTGDNTTQISQDDTAAVVKELRQDGIGYAIADQALNNEKIRVVQMHKTLPDDPRYPYSQPRNYVYQKDTAPPEVLAFLGLVTSGTGKAVVELTDKQGQTTSANSGLVGTAPSPETDRGNEANNSEVLASPSPDSQTETSNSAAPGSETDEVNEANNSEVLTSPSPDSQTETSNSEEVLTPLSSENETEITQNSAPVDEKKQETETKGFPWWLLLLLGIPLIGALAWLLLKGRGDDSLETSAVASGTTTDSNSPPVGGTAVAGVAEGIEGTNTPTTITPTPEVETETIGIAPIAAGIAGATGIAGLLALWKSQTKNSQINLTAELSQTASAKWSVPETDKEAAKFHGGKQYQLRVYDVTDIDIDSETSHSLRCYDSEESNQQWQIGNLLTNREYQAEIGYLTDNNQWLLLARSNRVQIVEYCLHGESVIAKEVDLLGKCTSKSSWVLPPSQITITPDGLENMIVAWEVPEIAKNAAKEQGGEQYQMRVYDVTNIDLDKQPAYNIQAYDSQESSEQLQIPVFVSDREYQAEIGYATDDGEWLPLARSNRVWIATPNVALQTNEIKNTQANLTPTKKLIPEEKLDSSWIAIVPHNTNSAYVHWAISQTAKDAAKEQGQQQCKLRILDVTDIDLDSQPPHKIEEYDCQESKQKQQIPINISTGDYVDYVAEIGYLADNSQWLQIACSQPLRMPVPVFNQLNSAEKILPVAVPLVAGAVSQISESKKETVLKTSNISPGNCEIQHLTIHSRHNCYFLNDEQMTRLQETAVSNTLEPGTYIMRIKSGTFGYGSNICPSGEPFVLLWIFGGKVKNNKTKVPVEKTWSTLNGYNETLTLEVLETTNLYTFFLDSYAEDNEGEVTVSIAKLYS
ncbi:MAG: DUF4912 domain-containing protein [Trichodesmium sp.]